MITLCAELANLAWEVDDEVTVYYPKVTDRSPDLGRHLVKKTGNIQLHSVIDF